MNNGRKNISIGTSSQKKKELVGQQVLILDNYDSFTYNLVHLVEKITKVKPDVLLNDRVNLKNVTAYDKIILSPGPGIPEEAGSMLSLIAEYASCKSILGVCLGHQGLARAFGARLLNLSTVYHGVANKVRITCRSPKAGRDLFDGLPDEIQVGRYHSWIVSDEDFPAELEVTARDEQGNIMAIRHRILDVQGVQFHPESILTPEGEKILYNWLRD